MPDDLTEPGQGFRLAPDTMMEGCQVIGFDWRCLYINDAAAGHGRISREDALGKTVMEIYPGIEKTQMFAVLQECMSRRTPYRMQYAFRFPNGSEGWFELSMHPVPEGVFMLSLDITERKRAEEELRESERKYRSIFENVADAIMKTSPQGEIIAANPAAGSILGYDSPEDLAECVQNVADLYFDVAERQEIRQRLREHGVVRDFETRFRRKDGSAAWIRLNLKAIRDPHGRITAFLEIWTDITQGKETEEALQKSEEDLKQAQAMLIHSDKMASIGQLAAGVAHEINNPMGFINSNLNTMAEYVRDLKAYLRECEGALQSLKSRLDGQVDPEYEALRQLREAFDLEYVLDDSEKLIRESIDGSQRVKKIVQDLRTFSRAGNGADVQLANIEAVLDSALNIVWNELKYTCTVTKDYGKVPEIECNPNQLGQVFVNILVNASQAIGKDKHGEIRIRTYAAGGAVFVEAGDNGAGIPPEQLGKVFDPFFTTKPVGQGTGLGLSISYNIVQKHGGQISVRSEPGIGTTFTVKLPVPSLRGREA